MPSAGGGVRVRMRVARQPRGSATTLLCCRRVFLPLPPSPPPSLPPSSRGFLRSSASFTLHHERHSQLCIHDVISAGPVWRVSLHSSPPWLPTLPEPFQGLSIPEGRGRELTGPHFRHTTQNGASSSSVADRR